MVFILVKMRKLFYFFIASLCVGSTLSSCNEELDLIGEFKETAVVYGLLDQADSVHLIKITRAFISPDQSSLTTTQIADSNYFDQVDARIEEWIDGVKMRTWNLHDTTITNKSENGIFYAPEQKLYVFYTNSSEPLLSGYDFSPNKNINYKLVANINNGEFTVQGETSIVSGISTTTDSWNYSFSFKKSTGEYKTPTINVNVGNSYILNTTLDVDYEEFIGGTSSIKRMSWKLGEIDVTPGTSYNFTANGVTFYEQMAASCATSDPLVDKRNMVGITVRVTGGSEEFYNYMLVNQPSSSIAQNKPTYTNLEATNDHQVIGILGSRYIYKVYHPFVSIQQSVRCLDFYSTKELCVGVYTNPYLFCSNHSLDIANGESWACN